MATQDSGGRDGPRRTDGDARTKHRVRAQTPRRSHHPEVAPDVSILRRAQNRYVASGRVSVHDRGNQTTSLGFSMNPALAFSVDTGPPLAGCLPTGRLKDGQPRLHRLEGRRNFSDRLGDGQYCSPASYDARAALNDTLACPSVGLAGVFFRCSTHGQRPPAKPLKFFIIPPETWTSSIRPSER